MTDLDTLRPEVRESLDKLGYFLTGTHNHNDFYTIRAELLRLVAENHELRAGREQARNDRVDEIRQRVDAEAELAALKARIAEAPEYRCEADIISGRDGDYISAVLIHDDNAFQYPDVDGKRVRLLVEDDK